MGEVMLGGWRVGMIAGACVLSVAGCAVLNRTAETVVTPVKYAWVRADTGLRENLQRGLTQLESGDFQGAMRSLNRSIWDLQRIDDRGLRMAELARAYRAIGDTYGSVRKPQWAEAHWELAATFTARSRQAAVAGERRSSLDWARAAYVSAQFPESVVRLRRALIDLEEAEEFGARLKQLEEVRCYLVFSYVALGQEELAREESQRLLALDASSTFCTGEAPPKVRRLISEVRRSMAR